MNTATATETQILIAKCAKCSHITKVEREWKVGICQTGRLAGRTVRYLIGGYVIDQCEECHNFLSETKLAKVSKIRCGAKCVNATGPACSCECGGKNHGGH